MEFGAFLKLVKVVFGLLVVLAFDICLADFALAASPTALQKTYAVFVAAYNSETGAARGGVAGTAFFTSNHTAVTAYHVLQEKSFVVSPGFTTIQIWLVHENEPAVEINLTNLTFNKDQDLTLIELGPSQNVSAFFVYSVGKAGANGSKVRTEGFYANSIGPKLIGAIDGRLKIESVPSLSRLNVSGELIQSTVIHLEASDVNLPSSRCVQLSYQPVVGLSGGPVIANGKVIGMNSFADPTTRLKTWAIAL